MGRYKPIFLGFLLVATLLCLPTFVAFAEDVEGSEGIGEYVSEAAPKGPGKVIPPGHYGLIAKYADKFLSNPPGPHRTIFAETLMDGIDDPSQADELHDFFVLDIRSKEISGRRDYDYCIKGHIPGAVWIPFEDVAKPENLVMLPADRPILIVCYTGHTASQINTILNMLGYNVWTLRFGMTSWYAKSSTAVWSPTVKQDIYGADYPVEYCP